MSWTLSGTLDLQRQCLSPDLQCDDCHGFGSQHRHTEGAVGQCKLPDLGECTQEPGTKTQSSTAKTEKSKEQRGGTEEAVSQARSSAKQEAWARRIFQTLTGARDQHRLEPQAQQDSRGSKHWQRSYNSAGPGQDLG